MENKMGNFLDSVTVHCKKYLKEYHLWNQHVDEGKTRRYTVNFIVYDKTLDTYFLCKAWSRASWARTLKRKSRIGDVESSLIRMGYDKFDIIPYKSLLEAEVNRDIPHNEEEWMTREFSDIIRLKTISAYGWQNDLWNYLNSGDGFRKHSKSRWNNLWTGIINGDIDVVGKDRQHLSVNK